MKYLRKIFSGKIRTILGYAALITVIILMALVAVHYFYKFTYFFVEHIYRVYNI